MTKQPSSDLLINRAKSLLLEQYKESLNINKLIELIGQECHEVEKIFFDLLDKRNLANSEGAQLDGLGQILSEKRNFREDEEYRLALYIKTLINNCSGTPEEIKTIVRLLYKVKIGNLIYQEKYPAAYYLHISTMLNIKDLRTILKMITPATVSFEISYINEEYDKFIFNLTSVGQRDYNINYEEELLLINNQADNLLVTGGVTVDRGGRFNILVYDKLFYSVSDDDIYEINNDNDELIVSSISGNEDVVLGNIRFANIIYFEEV